MLSRPPLLTPTPSPFEEAYFFYQKRLHERLALPFSRYFYFKSGTPADADYKLKAKQRGGAAARELGGYTGYGEEAWNDELLVGDSTSTKAHEREVLVKDAKRTDGEDDGKETEVKVLGRRTESDKSKDERRLDRMLGRTLYLVVKGQGNRWRFPVGSLEGRENLGQVRTSFLAQYLLSLDFLQALALDLRSQLTKKQAAERILIQTAGLNMNTWIVGHAPIGHQTLSPTPSGSGSKVFFMKGRIMAGQANLEGNVFGWSDFKWLTREEVQRHVGNRYWSDVRNMLADR